MEEKIAVGDALALNVLSLGVKNDGSEDVSEIVNRYTKESALFFPAGQYKVSHPLTLENPVYGVGYARTPKPDMAHTWLLSEIEHPADKTDPSEEKGVIRFGGSGRFAVENLNIVCHSWECGILIDPCIQATATLLNKLGIYAVRGYGVLATKGADVPGFASRPLFFQNMTIFGTSDYPFPCVGIQIDGRIGDNRFDNIEIMGTRVGVVQEASFIYADNMHIWTGCLAGRDNGSWWETTRGLILGEGDANFIASNIYLDTAFGLVEFRSQRNLLSIQNFMSWEDGSVQGCDRCDARMFLIPDGLPDSPSISLTDGLVFVAGNDGAPGKLCDLTAPGPNVRVKDVRILTDYAVSAENWRRFTFTTHGTPSYGGTIPAGEAGEGERYVRIAAVAAEAKGGACVLRYTDDGGNASEITLAKRTAADGTVRFHAEAKEGPLGGREFYGSMDERLITLYAKIGAEAVQWRVDTVSAGEGFFPLDLGLVKNHRDFCAVSEILRNPADLIPLA